MPKPPFTYKTRGGEIVTVQAKAKPKPKSEPTHFSKRILLESGWTRGLILKYLGAPDCVEHKRNLAWGKYEVHLYAISRVEEAEARPDFQADAQAVKRKKRHEKEATHQN